MKSKETKAYEKRYAEFEKLQRENEKIRDEINKIFKDFNIDESKKDLWLKINSLIENELEQEEMCGE